MPGTVRRIPVRAMRVRQHMANDGDMAPEDPTESHLSDEDNDFMEELRRVDDDDDDDDDDVYNDDEDIDEGQLEGKSSVVDMFSVGGAKSQNDSPGSCQQEAEVESAEPASVGKSKKRRWKNFKEVMKKKLSRKKRDKNGVEEISIKPDRSLHGNHVEQCWTTENATVASWSSEVKDIRKAKSLASLSISDRSGSASSTKSENKHARADLTEDDDGIETIYDAEYQGGS